MFVCFIFFAKHFGSNLIVKDAEGGKIKRKGERKTKNENTKQEKEIKIRNEKEKKEIGIRKKGPPTVNNIYLTLCISRAILCLVSGWSSGAYGPANVSEGDPARNSPSDSMSLRPLGRNTSAQA
jgi:hypothetical protein